MVQAGVCRLRVFRGETPEGVLDDARRVGPHAQLQVQCLPALVAAEEILVTAAGPVPALVLDKGLVTAEVHRHGPPALGAAGDQLGGDAHVVLLRHHPLDGFIIVIRLLMAGLAALPQAVIPLGVKDPFFVEPHPLKLVVYVGGQHKVVSPLHQRQQGLIHRQGRGPS